MMTKKEENLVKSTIRKISGRRKAVNNVRKRCKIVLPTGEFYKKSGKPKTLVWNVCEFCGHKQRENLDIDHIIEIGKVVKLADSSPNWNDWIPKVLCEESNLQGLCKDCHKVKTSIYNKGKGGGGEYYL